MNKNFASRLRTIARQGIQTPQASQALARDAGHLLAALAAPRAFAMMDPSDPARLIVRREREGVSLGAGAEVYVVGTGDALDRFQEAVA
ncbi:MAG: hypothetical protein ACOCS7_00465 [Halolamina sp.]